MPKIAVRWSTEQNDIIYKWDKGIPKADAHMIHNFLSGHGLIPDLIAELESRGYDITTFRLTIAKKESPKVGLEQDQNSC